MGEILRIGICDDKEEDLKLIKDVVRESIQKIGISVHIKCSLFLHGEEMYEAEKKEHFDLFLLDIEMPEPDGFQLAKRICSGRTTPCLIFVSAHESFVFDSQEFMPLWFVRKTMLKKDMYKALQKYFELTSFRKASYSFKGGSVHIRNIVYIECSGHSLTIQKADGKIIKQCGSLKLMEEDLAKYNFLRIHKNYLVNLRYIEDIGKQEIHLINGTVLEMGRDRRKVLIEAVNKYEGENHEYE